MPGTADPSKPCDPFQPFGSEAIDPFQSKKGVGDPFSGKDPFALSSASSKDPKDSPLGFADFSSVSWDGWYCLIDGLQAAQSRTDTWIKEPILLLSHVKADVWMK